MSELPDVAPEEENLVVLDGAQRPYEWQPTISAAWYADGALQPGVITRLDVLKAYIVGYNEGARDEKLRTMAGGAEHFRGAHVTWKAEDGQTLAVYRMCKDGTLKRLYRLPEDVSADPAPAGTSAASATP